MPENIDDTAQSAPRSGFGSELFWKLLATVIFLSVLWILWLLWQITPKSTVNPIVFQIQQSRQSASGVIQGAPTAVRPGDVSQSVAPARGAAPASALSTGRPLDSLKLESELKAPPKSAAK